MEIYVVLPGDSVDMIAQRYGVSVQSIIFDNQLEYPYRLAVGQALLIRIRQPAADRKSIISNGYAYPFIDPEVLDQTLPYLSELSVFSYGFTKEGELIPPELDESWMIKAAKDQNTLPILTLTPLDSSGSFNNVLVSVVVHDFKVQQRLILEVAQTVLAKGYGGVDLDFEYVLAEDRIAYAQFTARMTAVMNQFGYQVSVALAPKTSRDQPGLLYEGKDYLLLGQAANHVLLMTYEWGYTYSSPMAVAPVNMVQRVVEYALTEIPADKISLGIPNYGYDWPLPYVKDVTKAQSIGNVEAVQIAVDHGSEIFFDPVAQTPYFRYWQYGILHEVWFEDVRSLRAKFQLIQKYGLRGPGYWQVMRLFRANWLLLEDTFRIRK